MKNGKPFVWTKNHTFRKMSLHWFANYTQDITNINFINPAPADPKKSKNGYKI